MDKLKKAVLFAILLLATALRIWGINFGLPYQFHQDEPIIVNHALAYGTGDLNPHFFIIPPLTSYVLFFFYALYFLSLKLLHITTSQESFAISFFTDPSHFYLIGRVVIGMVPGIINAALTYHLAKRFCSEKASLFSALIMSAAFLNVINSHYIYTDNLLVMFVLLAYVWMASLIENPSARSYVMSALFTGLAVATKYNGFILSGSFAAAECIRKGKECRFLNGKTFLFGIVAAASFVICNPFSVLDLEFFLSSVTGRIMHGYTGLSHHIVYSLFEGAGGILTISGMAGLILFLKSDFKKAIFLVSFPLLFYAHLVFASQPYSRYALALMPFLSIGAAFFLFDWLYPRLHGNAYKKIILIFLSLVFVLPTLEKSMQADLILSRKDTRAEAAEWIEKNVPPDSKIALDHTFFGPSLPQNAVQLKEKAKIINAQTELKKLKERKLDFQMRALKDRKAYEVFYITAEGEKAGQFLIFWPIVKDNIAALEEKNMRYIVLSGMSYSDNIRVLRDELERKARILAAFSPYKDGIFRASHDSIDMTNIPIKSKELFSRKQPGPCLIIYELR